MPHPIDARVGARVRALRRQSGLSQTRLADVLGISFQQVQKYEKGQNRIGASRLVEIARAFAVPVAALFEDLEADATEPPHHCALSSEGLRLIHAFAAIDSKSTRRTLIAMAEAIAERGE